MSQLFWRTARGWVGRSGAVQEKSICTGPGDGRHRRLGQGRDEAGEETLLGEHSMAQITMA